MQGLDDESGSPFEEETLLAPMYAVTEAAELLHIAMLRLPAKAVVGTAAATLVAVKLEEATLVLRGNIPTSWSA